MSENVLAKIDEAFARRTARRIGRPPLVQPVAREAGAALDNADSETDADAQESSALDHRWLYLFMSIQFFWGVLLFVPGAQAFRSIVRALPYVSGLGLLCLYLVQPSPVRRPKASALLLAALLLLTVNLLHSSSQLTAGIAQCLFQLCIAAPMFWAYKTVRSPRQAEQLLVFVLFANFVSAALGVLQVYEPARFMPPQLSGQLDADWLDMMTYVGASGQTITRPPGLSDTPGGAAVAGGLTALLGLGLTLRARKPWQTACVVVMSAIGLAAVYLAQVRSVLLMTVGAAAVLGVMALRQGRFARAGWLAGMAAALVVASFFWAASVGGSSIERRFLDLREQGTLSVYRENRGAFLAYTTGELLEQYPLGAGVGRWGMMNQYFGNPNEFQSTPIYVEIQLTGWLLDGGVPMWLLYGGAILLSMFVVFRMASSHDSLLSEVAMIVMSVQVFITGMSMAGPAFNTQLGILFWTLVSATHGAASSPGSEESEFQRPFQFPDSPS
jgi:hypothetical protein